MDIPASRLFLIAPALVSDLMLTRMGASSGELELIVEGTFAKNLAFCQTLGALRPKQRIFAAEDAAGAAPPCWRIGRQPIRSRRRPPLPIVSIAGLDGYREAWTAAVT